MERKLLLSRNFYYQVFSLSIAIGSSINGGNHENAENVYFVRESLIASTKETQIIDDRFLKLVKDFGENIGDPKRIKVAEPNFPPDTGQDDTSQ